MLPLKNRQLILIGTNLTGDAASLQVHKFHHPITHLARDKGSIVKSLLCRNGNREIANIKQPEEPWMFPVRFEPLDLEKYTKPTQRHLKKAAILYHYVEIYDMLLIAGSVTEAFIRYKERE